MAPQKAPYVLEIPRTLRLGVMNLFGIAIPGFLILFFSFFGFFVPAVIIALDLSHSDWNTIIPFFEKNTVVTAIVIILFSYVAGYILRLSTPDDLDKVSAEKVLKKLREEEPGEIETWPYTEIEGDKFPYFNFQRYLFERGLGEFLYLVRWEPDPKGKTPPKSVRKRL